MTSAEPAAVRPPRAWLRYLRGLLGVLILYFVGRHLLRNWEQFRGIELSWQIRPLPLIGAVLVIVGMYALLVEAWRQLAAAWGWDMTWRQAARVWIISSMGKYLPGKVWTVAGVASFAQEAGVSVWAATGSALVNQVLSLAAGAAVAALTGFSVAPDGIFRVLIWISLAGGLVGLAFLVWPGALGRIMAVATSGRVALPIRRGPVVLAVAIHAVSWAGYGVALLLVLAGTLPDVQLGLREAIAGFTISYIVGFLALLAPGGLGVREGTLVILLQGSIGAAPAVALAAASRLVMTVADIVAVAPFLAAGRKPK